MAAPRSLWMALVLLGTLEVPPALAWAYKGHHFQEQEFLGRWFAVGLASNGSWFLNNKDILSMCLIVVSQAKPENRDGVLNLTTGLLMEGKYVTGTLVLSPTDTPGHYTYTSPVQHIEMQNLWVEEIDSKYALLYTVCAAERTSFHLAMLYSRTETPEDAAKNKFTAFAAAKGFPKEDILFPPNTGKCMEGHQ